MERLFALEFNEKQQCFHFNFGYNEPDSFGWFTVIERCSMLDYAVFDSFISAYYGNRKLTKIDLLKSRDFVYKLQVNLLEYSCLKTPKLS